MATNKYLIETKRHKPSHPSLKVYWGPNSTGYTENPSMAGLYDEDKAKEICASTHGKEIMHPVMNMLQLEAAYMTHKLVDVKIALDGTTPDQASYLMNLGVESRKRI